MLKVENLSYSFPQKDLYEKISFSLEEGAHCAFIGTNGTGKSTLIQMIMEPEEYMFEGKMTLAPNQRIGYVSQFSRLEEREDISVYEYISAPFVKQQAKIDEICSQMEQGDNLEELMEAYQNEWDTFTAMDGDNYDVNIKKQLKVAGLSKIEQTSVQKISGGEFKLVQIIREMLTYPGLLIMDEPDVFLDFENLNGLRDLMNGHKGTLLVITHNRYLLNHCFNKILHLENAEIQEFDGSYPEYNLFLLETKIEQMALAASDLEEIERNRKIVERLRKEATVVISATKGRTLHARVSLLERLEARKTKSPFIEIPRPEIVLHTDHIVEGEDAEILKVENYSIAFEEELLDNVSFSIGANEKVAIVGENGTGKTTLLREIVKQNSPAITLHPEADFAYLSQMQGETLNENATVMQTLEQVGMETEKEVEEYLQPYGFTQDMIHQKISSLSGGEKNLLQLAVLSKGDANFLLLDEPTSHLDTYAQESLEKAVSEYNGAVLMVSHDFYTIANCVDYVLLVEDKTIRKISSRKFRKMIYANHFEKDYLEKDQKKKELENQIYQVLKKRDYEKAREIAKQLEEIVG